jgi:hypothetical protein
MMTDHRGVLRLLVVVLSLCGLALPASFVSASDPYGTTCNRNAYVSTWVKADGSPFTSTGDCVRYLAHGGELVPVFLDLSTIGLIPNSNLALSQVRASGLMPNRSYAVMGVVPGVGPTFTGGAGTGDGTIDSGGQFSYGCGQYSLLFTADFPSITTDILDAYGNPIGDEVVPEC